jgi:hypothetical protein
MAPRQGHFNAMKRVFGYLRANPKGRLVCDPSYPDHSAFHTPEHQNWKEFYPGAGEEKPHDMPTAKGKAARVTVYVDADHSRDQLTRRSVSGVILMVNNMPIRWICKRQQTVETSTYGSELVAGRMAIDLIVAIRYELRMLGVPLDGPALLLGDNMSVVLNTTVPSSVLKKKHCACAYHRIRESIAAGAVRFAHVSSKHNLADILTKPLAKGVFVPLAQKLVFRNSSHLHESRIEPPISNG